MYTGRFENKTQKKSAKGWYDRAVHYRKRTIAEVAKNKFTQVFEGSKKSLTAKGWAERAKHYRERTIEEKAKVAELEKQLKNAGVDVTANDAEVREQERGRIKKLLDSIFK